MINCPAGSFIVEMVVSVLMTAPIIGSTSTTVPVRLFEDAIFTELEMAIDDTRVPVNKYVVGGQSKASKWTRARSNSRSFANSKFWCL